MNNQKSNLDTFKAKLASNQVLSSKDIQTLKGGTSEPPPFGIEFLKR
ncbi:MAG: hypothetical protein AAF573_12915 [Bacteroidota bacterium]